MKPWQNLARRPRSSEEHGRPNEKDIFLVVGAALLTCQIAERLLKFYLINFIPKVNPKTLEKLFSTEVSLRTATLGFALVELRKRIKVEPKFRETLDDFLSMRNKLAHSAAQIKGWDFDTHQGRVFAYNYASGVFDAAEYVTKVLLGMVYARREQFDLDLPQVEFLKHIEADFAPLAKVAFPLG
jgi:hypothetical protein